MKQVTITIPDELEEAIERYRERFEDPPTLDAVVQRAIKSFILSRGYIPAGTPILRSDDDWYVPSIGGKPQPLENAPVLDEEHSVARAVIEDRR